MIITKLGTLTPHDLPSAPEVALRIVRACGEAHIDLKQLQDILSADVALSVELLRVVNAPYFGMRQPITKLEQALVVLGQRMLRNMALVFMARETLRAHPILHFDVRLYWEDCLRRAVVARLLAEAVGLDGNDAFTLGMLNDMGMLALLTSYPEAATAWPAMRCATPDQRHQQEMDLFGVSHKRVSQMLSERWRLPDELALPLAYKAGDFLLDLTPAIKERCLLLSCAEWMAAVYTATDKRLAVARCRHMVAENFNLDHHVCGVLLTEVPAALIQAAAALGIPINKQAGFEEVMANANRWMIEAHHRSDELVRHLEVALRERERLAEELQISFEKLARLAFYDPLTSLVNRRRFDELFMGEIARHSRTRQVLSLLLVDLDGFKQINDRYGHPAGDTVLQRVSHAMKSTLRASDVAARIGGDEFCILLPDTDVEGGKIAASRLQAALAALKFDKQFEKLRIGASVGGSSWCGDPSRGNERECVSGKLLEAADKALYASKNCGRNQISWMQLK